MDDATIMIFQNNFYKIFIRCGELFVYGDNLQLCKSHLDDESIQSVEDICRYCQQHKLRIYHKPKYTLFGLFEIYQVFTLTKKYSVRSTWTDVLRYLDTKF